MTTVAERFDAERGATADPLIAPLAPGIHRDVHERTYHRMDCLSRSILEAVVGGDSLMQIRWDMDHPKEPTPQMQLGTATHMAVLLPERFEAEVVGAPAGLNLTRNADKATWAEFQLEHAGKMILRGQEDGIERWDACRWMADAVRTHPFGRAILPAITDRELTCVWRREDRRAAARFRPDAIAPAFEALVDLKTIYSTNRRVIQHRLEDGYYRQAAFYRTGAMTLDIPIQHAVCFFVQSAPPWEVVPVRLIEEDLRLGWQQMDDAWARVDADWADGNYRGHAQDLIEIGLSEGYKRRALFGNN